LLTSHLNTDIIILRSKKVKTFYLYNKYRRRRK